MRYVFFFLILSLQNLGCILRLQHILTQTLHLLETLFRFHKNVWLKRQIYIPKLFPPCKSFSIIELNIKYNFPLIFTCTLTKRVHLIKIIDQTLRQKHIIFKTMSKLSKFTNSCVNSVLLILNSEEVSNKLKRNSRSPGFGSVVTNPTSIHEDAGLIPDLD